MQITGRFETVKSTTPGRYEVIRKFQFDGSEHVLQIECSNPAYATRRLDELETEIVKTAQSQQRRSGGQNERAA